MSRCRDPQDIQDAYVHNKLEYSYFLGELGNTNSMDISTNSMITNENSTVTHTKSMVIDIQPLYHKSTIKISCGCVRLTGRSETFKHNIRKEAFEFGVRKTLMYSK